MRWLDNEAEEDWPKSVSCHRELVELDDSALCSICRDYFNTPLSLLCGHSFCADCIRSNIQFQEQNHGKAHCPKCREPTDSRQIFPNHSLRDLVKQFLLVRPALISALQSPPNPDEGPPRKKRRSAKDVNGFKSSAPIKKRPDEVSNGKSDIVIQLESASEEEAPQRELRKRSTSVEYYPDPPSGIEEQESEDQYEEESSSSDEENCEEPTPKKRKTVGEQNGVGGRKQGPKPPSNWAQCPVCQQNYPLAMINDHIDRCLKAANEPRQNGPTKDGLTCRKGKKANLVVPPKLLMALEKPNSLRDRLRKHGLSTKGSKQELEQRYTRFRVEVQTALDRNEAGVSYASIARRIMSREQSECNASVKAPVLRAAPSKNTVNANESEFDDLIRATRLRNITAKQDQAGKGSELRAEEATASGIEEEGKEFEQKEESPKPDAACDLQQDFHEADQSPNNGLGWGRRFKPQQSNLGRSSTDIKLGSSLRRNAEIMDLGELTQNGMTQHSIDDLGETIEDSDLDI